jgi:hypothetical protein
MAHLHTSPSSGGLVDDLGLPTESDADAFAVAFAAVRRCRAAGACTQSASGRDDLGFPREGDSRDFARAFLALRAHLPAAQSTA